MHWFGKSLLWIVGSFALLASLAVTWLLLPQWGTPVARLWYETGFDAAVTHELEKLPGAEQACIYDDTMNIFVTSPEQLNVEKMLRRSLEDRALRRGPVWRDPHFRIFADGRTYYWSFRDKTFHVFYADRFTLAGTAERLCKYYGQWPDRYREMFRFQYGIEVNAANFCCGVTDDSSQ